MEHRVSVMERLQLFFIPMLVLIGGDTLFAIFTLLGILQLLLRINHLHGHSSIYYQILAGNEPRIFTA